MRDNIIIVFWINLSLISLVLAWRIMNWVDYPLLYIVSLFKEIFIESEFSINSRL